MSGLVVVRDAKTADGWLEIDRYEDDEQSEARLRARNCSIDGSTVELWRERRGLADVTVEGRWVGGEEQVPPC